MCAHVQGLWRPEDNPGHHPQECNHFLGDMVGKWPGAAQLHSVGSKPQASCLFLLGTRITGTRCNHMVLGSSSGPRPCNCGDWVTFLTHGCFFRLTWALHVSVSAYRVLLYGREVAQFNIWWFWESWVFSRFQLLWINLHKHSCTSSDVTFFLWRTKTQSLSQVNPF